MGMDDMRTYIDLKRTQLEEEEDEAYKKCIKVIIISKYTFHLQMD